MTDQPAADTGERDAPDQAGRWQQMLDLLADRGRLGVGETAATLGVSEATVRRDFAELARQQLVRRTHGGVVSSAVAYGLAARYRSASDEQVKARIATAAAALVTGDIVVGFNGGTTTSTTAREVAARVEPGPDTGRPALTVVTNALNIAAEMVLRPHIRTVSLGGVARPQSYEMTGPLARLVLDELWLDLLVLGVDGLTADAGASCEHVGEAGISAQMVERSTRVVVVADGSKVGRRTFARICPADRIDTLVTDDSAPADALADLRAAGIEVVVA
ncbi:MAG TPA: DeoR/GlpR family DNA-binding transcription regulator [Jiangellaceae bacterium]